MIESSSPPLFGGLLGFLSADNSNGNIAQKFRLYFGENYERVSERKAGTLHVRKIMISLHMEEIYERIFAYKEKLSKKV